MEAGEPCSFSCVGSSGEYYTRSPRKRTTTTVSHRRELELAVRYSILGMGREGDGIAPYPDALPASAVTKSFLPANGSVRLLAICLASWM